MQPMCEEHRDLLKAYREAVAALSRTLEALETARATAARAQYQRMAQHVEEARRRVHGVWGDDNANCRGTD